MKRHFCIPSRKTKANAPPSGKGGRGTLRGGVREEERGLDGPRKEAEREYGRDRQWGETDRWAEIETERVDLRATSL